MSLNDIKDFWLPIAQGLPVGSKVKVNHPEDAVGKAPSLDIFNTPTGYGCKDYRRHTTGWHPKTVINLAEVRESKLESGSTTLPLDLVNYDPHSSDTVQNLATAYFLKRNLDPELMPDYGWTVSASRMRLVFYGEDSKGQGGAIGRDVTEKHVAKSVNYYQDGTKLCDLVLTTGQGGATVLVEDINSAVKIHHAVQGNFTLCSEVISLNGTSINNHLVLHLIGKDVILWLDGDDAGVQGAVKIYRDLKPFVRSLKIIKAKGDPKDYTYKEICDSLWASHPDNFTAGSLINLQEVL